MATMTLTSLTQLPNRWFQPRTKNPTLAFRERTIRMMIAFILPMVAVALFTSLVVFSAVIELVSYPTAEIVVGLFLIGAAVAIHQGRITLSGYMLVGMFIFFSTFALIIPSQGTVTPVLAIVVSLIVVTLVLPRSAIIQFTLLSSVLTALVLFISPQYKDLAGQLALNFFIPLAVIAILLYLLRTEFDSRLLSTEAARRETEQALTVAQAARSEAERANKAKDQFLSIMSHELRTPLGAIIGFVGILQSGMIKDRNEALPLSKTQQDMLKSARVNAEHLLTLINSILDLAKVSSGRVQASLEPINPCDENFIQSTVTSLKSLAIGKGIELNLIFGPDLPSQIRGDSLQIKQVVKNLVGNAIKFTDKGQVDVKVNRAGADRWEIIVQDTGIGIRAEQTKHIFDPFYQGDNSDSRAHEGTGLGLAIAKSYIELHDGTIQVQSILGTGTTFTVQLPCAPTPKIA